MAVQVMSDLLYLRDGRVHTIIATKSMRPCRSQQRALYLAKILVAGRSMKYSLCCVLFRHLHYALYALKAQT